MSTVAKSLLAHAGLTAARTKGQPAALAGAEAALADGRTAEALDLFRLAQLDAPADARVLCGVGDCLARLGRLGEAAAAVLAALEADGRNASALALIGRIGAQVALAGGAALPTRPGAKALLAVFACDTVDHQQMLALALAYLQATPFARALAGGGAAWLLSAEGAAVMADPVLQAMLARTVNLDPAIEAMLTELRRLVILDRRWRDVPPAFLAALARQCRNNEWVWFETEAEQAALAELGTELAGRMEHRAKVGPELLAWALYRPLARLPGFTELGRRIPVAEPATRAFAAEEVRAAREEAQARAEIPVLTALCGEVSERVAAQYEEHPYPRWLGLTPPEADPAHAHVEDVLVAGCGTGKQAVAAALTYGPQARVLAVDISRASLAYAVRMTRRLKVTTVDYAQADILALGGLDRRFDVVECTGVLHHMDDPMAGWRVLAGLLKPGGTMRVSLYSRTARAAVIACRELIARSGIGDDDQSIRRFRRELMAGAHPGAALAATSADLYALSEVRDLLFHAREVQFDLPAIEAALAELGLEFVDLGVPPAQAARLLAEAGERPGESPLACWHRIEQHHPRLFEGMYRFRCRRPA
ncbi:MAG: class I SAM-dependent methyltransferase [Actinomycetota bacterium]